MSVIDTNEHTIQLPSGEPARPADAKPKRGRKPVASLQRAHENLHGLPPVIEFTSEGLKLRVTRREKGEEVFYSDLVIEEGLLRVIGQAELPNGKWVRIVETQGAHQKSTGARTTLVIHNEDVHSSDLLRRLRGLNLNILPAKTLTETLGKYILSSKLYDDNGQLAGDLPYWDVASKSGWHGDHFVMPSGEIISPKGQDAISAQIISDVRMGKDTPDVSIGGTEESWRKNVAPLIKGNPCLMLAVAANLAGPILKVCGVKAFGLHFYGESSQGKTTALLVGSSVFGLPEERVKSWNATTLNQCARAHSANDMAISFDELKQVKPAEFETMAYNLLNGRSRGQCNVDGTMRDPLQWNTNILSSGEMTMEAFMRVTLGVEPDAGQLVRLLNIQHEAPKDLHGHKDGKAFALHLEKVARENYGAYGRNWIQTIVNKREKVKEAYQEVVARWGQLVDGDHAQSARVASHFTIMETALKLASQGMGLTHQEIEDTLYGVFKGWEASFTTDSRYTREQSQLFERCEAVLANIGRFSPANLERHAQLPRSDIWGYHDDANKLYYVLPEAFQKLIAKNMNPTTAARLLVDYGMAVTTTIKRGDKKVTKYSWQNVRPRVGDDRIQAYCLRFLPDAPGE